MSENIYESKRILVTRLAGPKGVTWIQLNVKRQDEGWNVAQMPADEFLAMCNSLADRD